MLKPNETNLRSKRITITSQRMLQVMKNRHSEKNEFEVSKSKIQYLMQNSILYTYFLLSRVKHV